MYKLLIVEDEILARIGLRQLLDWEKSGFVLLPDATGGEEALRVIREQEPDIILLDLNIPEINGLQLLRIMKEEKIASQVIIVSCHEEFEMVKEAMKLGAYDYMRKLNLSAKEMENVLSRCIKDRRDGKRLSPVLAEFRYDEIINRRGRNIFGNGQCYLTLSSLFASGEKAERLYELILVLKKQLDRMQEAYVCIRRDKNMCYFLFEEKKTEAFHDTLYRGVKQYFQGELYFGVCNIKIEKTEDLTCGIAMAEQIALAAYYDEAGQVVFFDKMLETKEHSPSRTHSREEDLKRAIGEFQKEETDLILQKLFQTIRIEKYISINVLRRIFMDILGFFSMTAQEIGKSIEELYVRDTNCHYQRLMQMNSLTEIEYWFLELNMTFYESFYIAYKSAGSEILRDVFAYIEAHLNEAIQLNEAAKMIGVSSTYLSTIFKKEIGLNFIEYVNMTKVEAAKEKLRQGEMVQEVSEALGFDSSTYFSKVFKKYAGVTPINYRQINPLAK